MYSHGRIFNKQKEGENLFTWGYILFSFVSIHLQTGSQQHTKVGNFPQSGHTGQLFAICIFYNILIW